MNPTERLTAVLRGVAPVVYATVIPPEVDPIPARAAVYIEVGEARSQNFLGSLRDRTLFRVQFRAIAAADADAMSRDFTNAARRLPKPLRIMDASTSYDAELRLHFRELSVEVP